jgi:hypothetical protein
MKARIVILAIGIVAAFATMAPAAQAATVPAHNSPPIYCFNSGEVRVDLPTYVTTPFRSEEMHVRFHLYKVVNGVWQWQLADDVYFTNFATYGGSILGGWLPNGSSYSLGQYHADFFVRTRGVYAVAMHLVWLSSNVSTFEWVGAPTSCDYR